MLSFEEKQAIIEKMNGLEANPVSLGRINYHYPESKRDKQIVVKFLHPNGNGFVYWPDSLEAGKDGFVNIRDYNASELEAVLKGAIGYLQTDGEPYQNGDTILFRNDRGEELRTSYENEMWIIYTGDNVEAVFPSLEAAQGYLLDEGFYEA